MGYEYGDAQNSAVRVFLNQFSKKFNTFFSEEYKQKTLKYFNYRCPYSGDDISNHKFAEDHVVPFNRECCGLHVYGNILLVTREANQRKHHQSLENFLKNEPARLEKIQNFMKESGYTDIHEKYNKQLRLNCKALYEKVREVIEGDFRDFIGVTRVPDTGSQSPPINHAFQQNMPQKFQSSVGTTSQATLLTKSSNTASASVPQAKIPFKLLNTDKKNNKYCTFPENEDEFKREAFQDREIFVRVMHPNGHVEDIVRRVSKIWSTSVYWNINSMPTPYRGLNHLSHANNLTVYACPIRYKDSVERGNHFVIF